MRIASRLMLLTPTGNSFAEAMRGPGLEYLKWPAPVYGGDTLRLQVYVLETRNSKSGIYGVVRWRWQLTNQRDLLVLELVAASLFKG